MVRPREAPLAPGAGVEPPFLDQLPAGGRPEGTSGDNQQKPPRDSQRGPEGTSRQGKLSSRMGGQSGVAD